MSKRIALVAGVAGLPLLLLVAWLERSGVIFEALPPPPARPSSAGPAAPVEDGVLLFRQFCRICHGDDGTGNVVESQAFRSMNSCERCHGHDSVRDSAIRDSARAVMSKIPDFTSAGWQDRRTDARMITSILDGKGDHMPAFRGRINEQEARKLVAHIRAFCPARK